MKSKGWRVRALGAIEAIVDVEDECLATAWRAFAPETRVVRLCFIASIRCTWRGSKLAARPLNIRSLDRQIVGFDELRFAFEIADAEVFANRLARRLQLGESRRSVRRTIPSIPSSFRRRGCC